MHSLEARMPQYLELDILAQQQRINNLYTQITFCFRRLEGTNWKGKVNQVLVEATERVTASFPCLKGRVVRASGRFNISFDHESIPLIIKDYTTSQLHQTWSELEKANFPFRLLDESWLAPCQTFASSFVYEQDPHVFLVQANHIADGLLLTFSGQHGEMDMTGLSAAIGLFAKACRNESFTPEELVVGNMDRKESVTIPASFDHAHDASNTTQSLRKDHIKPELRAGQSISSTTAPLDWAYFSFSVDSLSRLKASASRALPASTFVSTDDVLSALTWQCVTHVIFNGGVRYTRSTVSRNVDMRHHLDLPYCYPGLLTASTTHTWEIGDLISRPYGDVALHLRQALDKDALLESLYTQMSHLRKTPHYTTGERKGGDPETIEVRLSSWTKEACYAMDFGVLLGEPLAVRRPRFMEGAREGLVYFLPKTKEGGIMVGVCLTREGLDALREDSMFTQYAEYVG